ncbi:MAG: CDP-alcohol phosphatidyltransferase family protein [Gemmatimonadaceae bacterium]
MNLPNAFTAGRIAITPLIAWLPLAPSSALRFTAFVLFIVAAVSDYVDGHLARSRKQETDLGRLLDPLADKLLLLGTFVPMFLLMRPSAHAEEDMTSRVAANVFPFLTPVGEIPLTWWVLAIVLGREVFMTLFRQAAARRGVVIAAIGPAKWKTAFQWIWVGAAYFWFFAATLAVSRHWELFAPWRAWANINGVVGVLAMLGAIALTLYSLALYLRSYGRVFTGAPVRGRS